MTFIQTITTKIQQYVDFEKISAATGKLCSKTVEFLQTNSRAATGTVFAINGLFILFIVDAGAHTVNRTIIKRNPHLDAKQLAAKHGVLGIVIGGITYGFNVTLVRLTGYQMFKTTNIMFSMLASVYAFTRLQRKSRERVSLNHTKAAATPKKDSPKEEKK